MKFVIAFKHLATNIIRSSTLPISVFEAKNNQVFINIKKKQQQHVMFVIQS